MSFTRTDPTPDKVKMAITIDREQYPELAEWVWRRPWVAQEVVRRAMSGELRSGSLARIEQEVANEQENKSHRP